MGKKKSADVQFYTEVMDSVQTIEGGRRSMYDPDELEEEQRERDMRNKARAAAQHPLAKPAMAQDIARPPNSPSRTLINPPKTLHGDMQCATSGRGVRERV